MSVYFGNVKYVPGTYGKKRPSSSEMVDLYLKDLERKRQALKTKKTEPPIIGPTICFSRKIGVGALEIADILAERTGYRVIDREILANMNTKIILGNEMGPERKALIDSAAQDLSDDYQTIGSLDKGEAIVTSTFTKFAVPIQIPLFEDFIESHD